MMIEKSNDGTTPYTMVQSLSDDGIQVLSVMVHRHYFNYYAEACATLVSMLCLKKNA